METLTAREVSIFAQVALKAAVEQGDNPDTTLKRADQYLEWIVEQWTTYAEKNLNDTENGTEVSTTGRIY